MPVIEAIPKAVKLGANFVPQDVSQAAMVQATAQAMVTIPALMISPAGVPIPLPVIGIIISFLMTKLMAIPAEMTQKIVKIIADMQKTYNKQLADAQKKQADAQTKLYTDLTAKQVKIKAEVKTLQDDISKLIKEIQTLNAEEEAEMAKYQATIFEYAAKAKELDGEGKKEESEIYIAKIKALDYWLAQIVTMLTNIINKKLELKFMQLDLEAKKKLADMKIDNEWESMVEISTDFEVVVPYYPDLPSPPQYPSIPKFPEMPPQVRTALQMLNKWLVCPLVPPMGVTIAGLLMMIKEKVPNSPVTAAQLDAQAEAMIPRLGGLI